jgi:hypothetical protein
MVREDFLQILTQKKLVHNLALYFVTIYFNIVLRLRLRLPSGLLPSEMLTEILCLFSCIPCVLHTSSNTLALLYPHHQLLVKIIRHRSLDKALALKKSRTTAFSILGQNISLRLALYFCRGLTGKHLLRENDCLWDMGPSISVDNYQCFGETYCVISQV